MILPIASGERATALSPRGLSGRTALLSGGTKAKRGRKAGQAAKKSTGDKRAKVAPKYRNPANQSETWTGRGKMPKWCADMKAAGTLDSALIAN